MTHQKKNYSTTLWCSLQLIDICWSWSWITCPSISVWFLSDHKGNKQIGHLYVFLLLPENKHVGFPNKLPYMTWDHEIHEVIWIIACSFPSHFMALLEPLNSCPYLLTRDVGSPRVVWQLHWSTATMCCDPGPITINLKTIKSWRVNQPPFPANVPLPPEIRSY